MLGGPLGHDSSAMGYSPKPETSNNTQCIINAMALMKLMDF